MVEENHKLLFKYHKCNSKNNGYNGYYCGLFAVANMMVFVADRYHGLQDGRLGFV